MAATKATLHLQYVFFQLSLWVCVHTHTHTPHEALIHTHPSYKNALILLLLWNAYKIQYLDETLSVLLSLKIRRCVGNRPSPAKLQTEELPRTSRKPPPQDGRSAECPWPQTSSEEWQEVYESWSESNKQKCPALAALRCYKHRKEWIHVTFSHKLYESQNIVFSTSEL